MEYKKKLKSVLLSLKKWFVNLIKNYWRLNLEAKIGILFIIPPIIGVMMFILNLLILNSLDIGLGFQDFPQSWNCISNSYNPDIIDFYLTKSSSRGYGYAGTPAMPLYLGLMAIAGAYLIKGNLKK